MDTFTESGFTTINLCLTKNDGVILILSALSVFRALYQSIFEHKGSVSLICFPGLAFTSIWTWRLRIPDLFSEPSINPYLNQKVAYPGSVLRVQQ